MELIPEAAAATFAEVVGATSAISDAVAGASSVAAEIAAAAPEVEALSAGATSAGEALSEGATSTLNNFTPTVRDAVQMYGIDTTAATAVASGRNTLMGVGAFTAAQTATAFGTAAINAHQQELNRQNAQFIAQLPIQFQNQMLDRNIKALHQLGLPDAMAFNGTAVPGKATSQHIRGNIYSTPGMPGRIDNYKFDGGFAQQFFGIGKIP